MVEVSLVMVLYRGFTAAVTTFSYLKFPKALSKAGPRVVINATIGGTASKLSGRKFANGAAYAAFSVAVEGVARLYANGSANRHTGAQAAQKEVPTGPGVGYDDSLERTKDALRALRTAGEGGNEWGTRLYTDGEKYYFTALSTDGSSHYVGIPDVPEGFTGQGTVHNHPSSNSWLSGSSHHDLRSDMGQAYRLQTTFWSIDADSHVYRYVPPRIGGNDFIYQTTRHNSLPGFEGPLR